jgi:DNA-binding response OmpR family regulator
MTIAEDVVIARLKQAETRKLERQPLRVLVVDDDEAISDLVAAELQKWGVSCEHANNGEMALDLARSVRPDILVLDVLMPKIDGFEVLRALKRDENTKHIKIIMLTSCEEESDIARGFGLGADDYVTKPFNPVDLTARVLRFQTECLVKRRSASAEAE